MRLSSGFKAIQGLLSFRLKLPLCKRWGNGSNMATKSINFLYKSLTSRLWNLPLIISILLIGSIAARASSSLEKTYFVAAKSKEINLRAGPNIRYPVVLKLTRKFEPLKVTNKFEHWRQVEDAEGDKGWVHISNLTAKRMAKTRCKERVNLYLKPDVDAKLVAHIGNDVLFQVLNCQENWCKLEKDEIKGWVVKKHLWGSIAND